jgi:hypothetical protein
VNTAGGISVLVILELIDVLLVASLLFFFFRFLLRFILNVFLGQSHYSKEKPNGIFIL